MDGATSAMIIGFTTDLVFGVCKKMLCVLFVFVFVLNVASRLWHNINSLKTSIIPSFYAQHLWRVRRTHCQLGKAPAMGAHWAVRVRWTGGLMYRQLPGHHDGGVMAHSQGAHEPRIYIWPPTTTLLTNNQASSFLLLVFFFPTLHPNLMLRRPHCHPGIHRWLQSPAARAAQTSHQCLQQWNTSKTTHGTAWFGILIVRVISLSFLAVFSFPLNYTP